MILNARDGDVTISGNDQRGSSIFTDVETNADYDAGNIKIDAQGSILLNNAEINNTNAGTGYAGDIEFNAPNEISIKNSSILAKGNFGRIFIGNSISPQKINFNNSSLTVSNNSVTAPELKNQQIDAGEISLNAINNISFVNNSEISTVTERLGNAGSLTIQSENASVSLDNSDVFSNVKAGGVGYAGDIKITAANSISFINGAQLQSGIIATSDNSTQSGIGFGGQITLDAKENIILSGRDPDQPTFSSAIFTDVERNAFGEPGNIKITTSSLSLTDGAKLNTESLGFDAKSLGLELEISTTTGNIKIDTDFISLDRNSLISARAEGTADAGDININADFIVAYPNGNNDILTSAELGKGGAITFSNVKSLFGIQKRELNPQTNDINARSEVNGLDGTVNFNDAKIDPVQGATELPSNVVEAEQTTEQACQADRETAAKNGLVVRGKGGMLATPDQPLTSQNLIVNGEINSASAIPEPIETSQGKIQLARGIKVTKNGGVILTPYATNNAGERIPEGGINCGQI